MVRELTGGIYFGEKTREADRASDVCVYTADEVQRVVRRGAASSRGKRRREADLGGQGQRAGDLAAVA